MSPEVLVDHDWVRARFGRWAAGLLDEHEQHRVDVHLATCAPCQALAAGLQSDFASDEHLPPPLMARWAHRAPTLTGTYRQLVHAHLERCDDCRRELETLGADPALIRMPHLEAVGPPAQPVRPTRRPWRAMTAAAVLATAAGIIVLMRIPEGGRPVRTLEPGRAGAPPAVAPAPEAHPPRFTLGGGDGRVAQLPEAIRGGDASIAPLEFDPVRHKIAIALPRGLAMSDGQDVGLELIDARGTVRMRMTTTMADLFTPAGPRTIVIHQGEPPLAPGRYALRTQVSGGALSEPEEASYAIEIR